MQKNKRPEDVRGVRIKCPNFEQCPLCYGCRNFNSKYVKCVTCKFEGQKKNICDTKKHTAPLLSKMILKEKIEIK